MNGNNNTTTVPSPSDELGNSLASFPISPTIVDDDFVAAVTQTRPAVYAASSSSEERVRPASEESSESMSTGPDLDPASTMMPPPQARSSITNRSPASAIVPPFNYLPAGRAREDNSGGKSDAIETIKNAQIKRNSSYVSSMGRSKQETTTMANLAPVNTTTDGDMVAESYGHTSSSVVTLV